MDKCPFCGADTRPGDNFCLNCGNRLLATTPPPSPQQAPPSMNDATLAATEGWGGSPSVPDAGTMPSSPSWGLEDGGKTAAASSEQPTLRSDAPTAAPTNGTGKIEQPARFILRADNGDVLQEYPLDKHEITIGRAPNSDILLSKDKLTSRRHATVNYENGQYTLRDERSANGTFVNGQQIEDMAPHVLHDNDHVGIGEHELLFRAYGSESSNGVEDMPTVSVLQSPEAEYTWRTREDEHATVATSNDEYGTHSIEPAAPEEPAAPAPAPEPEPEPVKAESAPEVASAPAPETSAPVATPAPVAAPSVPVAPTYTPATSSPAVSSNSARTSETQAPVETKSSSGNADANITFGRITSLQQPSLPDISALMAALSALDGQVTALQDQLNSSQEALHNHEAEIAQTTNQLRTGVRRVSERMDSTIADVARSREALAWSELLQLMEDVMANPRDIEYVTKLARKARELNKVFQMHQNVLNTMAECNSLLRSMIGE